MRSVWWIAIALISLAPSPTYPQEAQTSAVPPLRLDLACESGDGSFWFRATLRNVSATETAVVIGLGDKERDRLPTGVVMVVRRAGLPDTELHYANVGNGTLSPWVVTLLPTRAYSVTLLPREFRWPDLTQETVPSPATVSLRLTARPSGRIPVWVGMLASNAVEVPSNCSSPQWIEMRPPLTIEVQRDVEVRRNDEKEVRGKLYMMGGTVKPFVVKKGESLTTIARGREGSCQITFHGRQFELDSCPWMEGYADHQEDVFRIISVPAKAQ